jgi:hypothetical protein
MTATNTEASTERTGWLSRTWRWWEKISAFLAIVALVDLTKQLIEWAKLIHEIAEKYAAVRAWLFGWLPFHVPPELHDPIVLLLLFFSVTNVGVYQRTKGTYISYIIKNALVERYDFQMSAVERAAKRIIQHAVVLTLIAIFVTSPYWFWPILSDVTTHFNIGSSVAGLIWVIIMIVGVFLVLIGSYFASGIITAIFDGAYLAWRWLLTTAAIFGALVAVNYAWVHWLEKLAEHH